MCYCSLEGCFSVLHPLLDSLYIFHAYRIVLYRIGSHKIFNGSLVVLHVALNIATIGEQIRILTLKILLLHRTNKYCFIVCLDCVFKFVEPLEIGDKIAKICVAQEVPGNWIFHVEHDRSFDDIKRFLYIFSSLLFVF